MKTITFDLSCFRLKAIQKACYRLSDLAAFELEVHGGNCHVGIFLNSSKEVDQIASLLRRDTLDQELREVVAAETSRVRDLLLAQAFSPLSLIDRTGEAADFREDPLGIGSPDRIRAMSTRGETP